MAAQHPDPTVLQNGLGDQIRRLRQEQQMTLEEIGAKSGLSVGALSQIERGKGNPAFFTLIKIAHALDVPVARLLHVERMGSPVVRRSEGRQLSPHVIDVPGVVSELLTPDLDRALQVARYTMPAGAGTEDEPYTHRGEEFLTVLAGVCEVDLNGVGYRLEAGDSISFESALPHGYRNPGPDELELILVCTPPTF